jgi:hypothetical protein
VYLAGEPYMAGQPRRCAWSLERADALRAICASCDELVCRSALQTREEITALETALAGSPGGARAQVTLCPSSNQGGAARSEAIIRLARHPRVVALTVSDQLQDASFPALCDALEAPGCPLRMLCLAQIMLDTEEMPARLCTALRSPSCLLRTLVLDGTFIWDGYDYDADEDGERRSCARATCTQLCNAFADMGTLQELVLREFSEYDAPAVALLLRASRSLRSLDVSKCELRCSGVAKLAAALALPTASLARLYIGGVYGRAAGAAALAEMLAVNTTLRELHTGGTDGFASALTWRYAAGSTLLHALERNTTLRLLTLPLPEDGDGELGHAAQFRELQLKVLRREHPRSAEVRLTDAFRELPM